MTEDEERLLLELILKMDENTTKLNEQVEVLTNDKLITKAINRDAR